MDHHQPICCMCGDVGFADKLFRCSGCRHRFQHSYCSSYYSEYAEPAQACDWCLSEERNSARQKGESSSKRPSSGNGNYKAKSIDRTTVSGGNKSTNAVPSSKTTRRYKLLKDVLC